ncbi:MAG: hypothetical protein WDO70_09890 [Alphaproteobacteria bacterium]
MIYELPFWLTGNAKSMIYFHVFMIKTWQREISLKGENIMSDAPSQLTEAVVGPKRNLDGLYNLAKELFADMADRVQVSPPVNACDSNSDAFFTIYSLTKKKKERCEEIARVGACGDSSYELHIGGLVCGRRLNDDIARNIVGASPRSPSSLRHRGRDRDQITQD